MTELEIGILQGLIRAALPSLKNVLGTKTISSELGDLLTHVVTEIETLLKKV